MKVLRAVLDTIVDIVMLPVRAIGRLFGAGKSTTKEGRGAAAAGSTNADV